jgi:hypothetical protein
MTFRLMPVVAAAVALSACAPGGFVPRPVSAALTQEALVLEMTSGQRCRLPRVAGDAGGWGGPVQGCRGVARVDVVLERPGLLEQLAGALTLESFVAPAARVSVTGPDGRVTVFVSPPELPLDLSG